MALLDKAAILAATDLGHEDVAVPEWGGTVRVRVMSGHERDAWEASFITQALDRGRGGLAGSMQNVRARLVAQTAVDADNARLFTDSDVEALGAKSAAALDRVFAVAQRLNGLNEKDIEELGKVFAAMAGGASSSSSPSV